MKNNWRCEHNPTVLAIGYELEYFSFKTIHREYSLIKKDVKGIFFKVFFYHFFRLLRTTINKHKSSFWGPVAQAPPPHV